MLSLLLLAALGLAGGAATAFVPSQSSSAPQAYSETIPGTLVTFEMVAVPAGTVTVDGKPVAVGPLYVGKTEATWDMFDVFALRLDLPKEKRRSDATARPSQPYGAPDYGWGHAGYPAISVTRQAAEAFASWLSSKTGKKYRLPTEAEWNHLAALASGGRPLSADRRDVLAWHRANASGRSHPVGKKAADASGLFDLFGNAAEWVLTSDGSLVVRGGSFRSRPEDIGPEARAAQDDSWNERDPQLPKSRWWLSDAPFVGFRIVRDQ